MRILTLLLDVEEEDAAHDEITNDDDDDKEEQGNNDSLMLKFLFQKWADDIISNITSNTTKGKGNYRKERSGTTVSSGTATHVANHLPPLFKLRVERQRRRSSSSSRSNTDCDWTNSKRRSNH